MEIISIHIPKTAGTAFHHVLFQVYGKRVSPALKRKDLLDKTLLFEEAESNWDVLHGHFYRSEITEFINPETRLITWVRDPVDRVISNYNFFIEGLKNPDRNRVQYERNKHRLNESLLKYAEIEGNRNRLSEFLSGFDICDFFFIGLTEEFENDIKELSENLGWTGIRIEVLNKGSVTALVSEDERALIRKLNLEDVALYKSIVEKRKEIINSGS